MVDAELVEGPFHTRESVRPALQVDEEHFVESQFVLSWMFHV